MGGLHHLLDPSVEAGFFYKRYGQTYILCIETQRERFVKSRELIKELEAAGWVLDWAVITSLSTRKGPVLFLCRIRQKTCQRALFSRFGSKRD